MCLISLQSLPTAVVLCPLKLASIRRKVLADSALQFGSVYKFSGAVVNLIQSPQNFCVPFVSNLLVGVAVQARNDVVCKFCTVRLA